MTPDPRGRWFRVYARQVRQHPKFRDLNVTQLGAWLVLRSEAELRDGACFTDRAEAILTLRRRHTPRPATMLDGLVALALFDVATDGTVTVHDRQDHDRSTFPSDDPEKVKERVRRHRQKKAETDPVTTDGNDETNRYEESNDSPRARAHSGAGADSVSTSDSEGGAGGDDLDAIPDDWDAPDAVVAYNEVTGRYPSPKVIDWLNRMSNDHPEEAIARVMAEQYADDDNLGTLLSRTDTALKLDQHRRNKADKKAREAAKAAAEAPHRQKEREATPEEREQAALQRQAIGIGLKMGVQVPTDPAEVRKFVMKYGSAA
ncbi:MAG: hypothetical protein M3N43_03975 [Actinomycetota bacterium]|nr:hypothetical protein [Actinomycetota bacterium]